MKPLYLININIFVVLFFLSSLVQSQTITPYHTSNKNPFIVIYGLPAAEPAQVLTANKSIINLSIDYVNNSRWMKSGEEELYIDGETQIASLRLRRGFGNKTQVGVDVPLISHNAGVADNVITDWHDLFQLPNNQRRLPYDKANQLKYAYIKNNNALIDIRHSKTGIGDTKLLAAWQLTDYESSMTLSLHGGVELPTGNTSGLIGSGSFDSFVFLSAQRSTVTMFEGLVFYGSAGLLHPGQGDILNDRLKFLVGFGSVGLQQRITEKFSFKLQTDLHSSLFDSSIEALGNASAQLVIGGTLKLSENYLLDVAIIENIFTDAVPDVAWYLAITRYY